MPEFECISCGNEQCFSSSEEEYYCYQCDENDLKNWKPTK